MEASSSVQKFDKKKWREKKYNKQYLLNQREENYKHILKNKLQRQLKKDKSSSSFEFTKNDRPALLSDKKNGPGRPSKIKQAQIGFEKKKFEKQKMKEERLKKKEDQDKALEEYKKKKMVNFQKLSKKTKKGQPVMKGRMQLLFEQVKKSVGNSS